MTWTSDWPLREQSCEVCLGCFEVTYGCLCRSEYSLLQQQTEVCNSHKILVKFKEKKGGLGGDERVDAWDLLEDCIRLERRILGVEDDC